MDSPINCPFETHEFYFTRGGSPAVVEAVQPTRILGAWYDGVEWHRTWWNLDGQYGLKDVPESLSGRSDTSDVFAICLGERKTALDILPNVKKYA